MSTHHRQANEFVQRMLRSRSIEQAEHDLSPSPRDGPQKIPGGSLLTDEAIRKRYEVTPIPVRSKNCSWTIGPISAKRPTSTTSRTSLAR